MTKSYFVYIITNYKNTVFYTGVTNNIRRRIWEHKHKLVDGFSKKYNLFKLVWFEGFGSINEAIMWEKKVKDYRREKKLELIKSKNPGFGDLMKMD